MPRALQPPRRASHNVRIYHNNGTLLASLAVEQNQSHLTWEMVYRYCNMILVLSSGNQWALFPLSESNGPIGDVIPRHSQGLVSPGNYLVLTLSNKAEIAVGLTTEQAPRRVRTQDRDSASRSQGQTERARLQARFRTRLVQRDNRCAISTRGPLVGFDDAPHFGLVAAHIVPVSQISQWNRYYKRFVDDNAPAAEIGESRLYSSQNGLLLSNEMHTVFDSFALGIDPDADYKIVLFGTDPTGIGGTRLKDSARHGTPVPTDTSANRVSPDLLRWHLKMCVYRNMKANAEFQEYWEEDFEEDSMGQIRRQPDAAERMEVELFTRLGELIA